MSLNKFNDLNEWEDDYYSRKHRSRTVTAGYLVWLIGAVAILAAFSLLFSCNRTTYSPDVLDGYQPIQHEKVACDTLIEPVTGKLIPVYNCETIW
jgi:hypothetical protein